MSLASPREPLLFQRFPALAERLAWRALGTLPTPVAPLPALSAETGHPALFVKRDDQSGLAYGGNKVRKLEFLLAHALEKGRREVITFGAVGSNHVVATAVYARQLGLQATAVVVPQRRHAYIGRNLRAGLVEGCRYVFARRIGEAPWLLLGTSSWSHLRGHRPYVIPPGGTNARGCLGYVEAGLEIADQVARGELPTPDDVFLPAGSLGSAVGLALGFALARLPARVVGVRVFDRTGVNRRRAARIWEATVKLLRKHDRSLPALPFSPAGFVLDHDQFGRGYAAYTKAGDEARALFAEQEGLTLEGTYTAKAAAAFLKAARRPDNAPRTLLFVNTYNSRPLASEVSEEALRHLPDPMRGYSRDSSSARVSSKRS